MSDTLRLKLPRLSAAQAQKHVTVNDGLSVLDALVQLAVKSRSTGTPPSAPTAGDRWIVGSGATGAWAGRTDRVAEWTDGAWRFHLPLAGWTAWVLDESRAAVYDGTGWVRPPGSFSTLGVNATADATNRIAASLANALFTDEGAGLRFKLNKTGAGTTASFLFQTGYSGRAEFGLVGGDDFKLKVSADGATFYDVLSVDRSTRALSLGSAGTGFRTAVANMLPVTTGGTERARFDDVGRVLIGHTASVVAAGAIATLQVHNVTGGAGIGTLRWSADANPPYFTFAKSRSTTVGTPGGALQAGDIVAYMNFAADDGASLLWAGAMYMVVDGAVSTGVVPTRIGFQVNTGAAGVQDALRIWSNRAVTPGADNVQTLGAASARWSVVYAGTGTINTSDGREKRWLGALPPAVVAAGRAIVGELGMFQWLDAIAEKGEDAARLHLGVTAQAVARAFDAAGLDPGRFALWTRTPLTRAVEEETVEGEGARRIVVERSVPDLEADGVTPKVRFGLRFDQLSTLLHVTAFARLDAIEDRLAAIGA